MIYKKIEIYKHFVYKVYIMGNIFCFNHNDEDEIHIPMSPMINVDEYVNLNCMEEPQVSVYTLYLHSNDEITLLYTLDGSYKISIVSLIDNAPGVTFNICKTNAQDKYPFITVLYAINSSSMSASICVSWGSNQYLKINKSTLMFDGYYVATIIHQ
jgi:hypothetical protein